MGHRLKNALVVTAMVAASAAGGAAIAGAANSNGSGSSSTDAAPPANMPPPGSAAHEAAEKPVTGDAASKAKAAALAYLGRGTAGAVTTDCSGNGYEVTVTQSDGSTIELHLDSSFTVMQHGGAPA